MNVPTTPRCRTVRSWVSAAHDDELSVERQVAMDSHLVPCAACRRAQDELTSVGVALRRAARRAPARRHGVRWAGDRGPRTHALRAEREPTPARPRGGRRGAWSLAHGRRAGSHGGGDRPHPEPGNTGASAVARQHPANVWRARIERQPALPREGRHLGGTGEGPLRVRDSAAAPRVGRRSGRRDADSSRCLHSYWRTSR